MERSEGKTSLLCLFLFTYCLQCRCDIPVVQNWPSSVTLPENIPIGTVMFNFTVKSDIFDEDISINTQDSTTFGVVNINQNRGNNVFAQVISKTELDRDGYGIPGKTTSILKFVVIDLRGNTLNLLTTLKLIDVNDNTPQLENTPYQWSISEYSKNGNETFRRIKATDLDEGINGNDGIVFKMEPIVEPESLVLEYLSTFSIDSSTGVIRQKRALDYEEHSVYHFNISATDQKGNGRTSESTILTITVIDVQDTPPVFTSGSYKALVRNDAEIGTHVITVHALDGDTGYRPMNAIGYYISPGGCSEVFTINDQGGINTRLHIDQNTDAFESACELDVVAQEVLYDANQQYGPIKTKATVYVMLRSKESQDEFDRCSSDSPKVVGTLLVTLLIGIQRFI
ncbi:cadherin EGF LAG seven-pass G-type receptor 2-like isoform X1 [Ruditapes philippinarum]|uniref:cadherin EGF LAG seven-pass G-type receptor 2-like isoform X1 n=1 Tax=Ruditapes philippinarum TaxID=129788 RepID=UPI00295AD0B2|nr:cadherin EGF LAG seven-pass G-type receptor 2-like isoform X1 [Ruditapes philippinarum]